MKNDGKIDGPVFKTFDTASVAFKPTKMEIGDQLRKNILSFIQGSDRPVLLGQAALRFDCRMNVALKIVEDGVESGVISKIENPLIFGLHAIADAYWCSEKLRKRI